MRYATLTTLAVLALSTTAFAQAQDVIYEFGGTMDDGSTEFTCKITVQTPLPEDGKDDPHFAHHSDDETPFLDWELDIGGKTYRRSTAGFRVDDLFVRDGEAPDRDMLMFFASDAQSLTAYFTVADGTGLSGDTLPTDSDAIGWDGGRMELTDYSKGGDPVVLGGDIESVSPVQVVKVVQATTTGEKIERKDGRGRSFLVKVPGTPHCWVWGRVDVRTRRDWDKLKIRVYGLWRSRTVRFLIGDGKGGFIDLGTHRGWWKREVVFDTRRGDSLPGGASWVGELFGRPVKVLDGNGKTVLIGVIPTFDEGRIDVAKCLKVRWKSFELSLKVKGLLAGRAYDLLIDGNLTHSFEADSSGRFALKLNSADGGSFFSLFPKASDLAGRILEIRTRTGMVVYVGRLPG